jgi:hypothetical protein
MENLPATSAFDDTDFIDFNHLNQDGADRLSVFLADRYTTFAQTR